MLISMLLDDLEDEAVSALYQVGPYVIQIKQRPAEGRVLDKELEDQQEQVMAQTSLEEGQRTGGYISAFPNVGLVVWQAGFVLAEWLIRTSPLGHDRWPSLNILELGCGVGQLGIPLACTGAKVTLTDLPHIIPLTEENVRLNAHAIPARPRVMPFVWGTTEPAVLEYGGSGGCNASAEQSTAHAAEHASKPAAGTAAAAGHEEVNPDLGAGIGGRVGGERRETAAGVAAGQPACSSGVWSKEGDSDAAAAGGAGSCGAAAPEQQGLLDMVVAADVLYEPQYYGVLLDSLVAACRMGGARVVPSQASDDPNAPGFQPTAAQQVASSSAVDSSSNEVAPAPTVPGGGSGGNSSGQGSGSDCGSGSASGLNLASQELQRHLPLCFICYRRRRYKEQGFEAMALARGFSRVVEVPSQQLHLEYQEGWRLIELVHDGMLVGS